MICSIVRQGGIHAFEGVPCQDNVCGVRRGNIQATVLCDGAGSLKGAREAAAVFSKALCEWVVNQYDVLLRLPEAELRQIVAGRIETILTQLSAEDEENRDSFGCTVLLCAANMKTGKALILQLGDGLIVEKSRGKEAVALTRPVQGSEHRSTYLTTSSRQAILSQLQVFHRSGNASYFLMSDGAEGALYYMNRNTAVLNNVFGDMLDECLLRPSSFQDEMEQLLQNHIRPTDDFSLSILCQDAPDPDAFAAPRKRLAKKYARYLAARRQGRSVASAAHLAGWRRRDVKKRRGWLQRQNIDEICNAQDEDMERMAI